MKFSGTNYFGNHQGAPQILQGTPNYNVEIGEGQTPPGEFYPAHYLPVVQTENRLMGSWFVLMPGKVVSLDSNKRLIGAGLAEDYAAFETAYVADPGNAAAKLVAGNAAAQIKYTANDEANGTVDAQGIAAVAGDSVAEAMYDGGSAKSIGVTAPVGIMRYSALTAPGTDPSNPATFFKHAYDTGGARAFSRWCYIQIPVVEVNERREVIPTGVSSFRATLYPGAGANGITVKASAANGAATIALTQYANPVLMPAPAGGATTADAFVLIGRTLQFNGLTSAGWTVCYTPKIDLPFTCLKTTDAAGKALDMGQSAVDIKSLLGEEVGYNLGSDFQLIGSAGCFTKKVGRILDVKSGTNEDLKLVLSYFRDAGLWQEQPGYATDGRNTMLSIANAPKYIARIAVNFNLFY